MEKKKKKMWARMRFVDLTPAQLEHLFEAEKHLLAAGVSFDTGFGRKTRDWELDWSLKGAKIECREED